MKEKVRLFVKFMHLALPYRRHILFILAASFLAALAGALAPYASRFVVDEGLFRRDIRAFLMNLGLAAGLFLLSEIFKAARHFLDTYVKARFSFDLNKKVFQHVQHLPMAWFKERSTGENVYKLDYDVTTAADFITQILPQAVSMILQGVVVIVLLLHLNARLFLSAFALAAAVYALPSYFGKKMARLCRVLIKNSEEVFKYLEEHLSHILLIKVFAREKRAVRGLVHRLAEVLRVNLSHARWEVFYIFTSEFSAKVVVGLIALVGGYEVIHGRMSVGVLTVVMAYLYQLLGLYNQVVPFVENVAMGLLSCQRISALLEEPREGDMGLAAPRVQKPIFSGGHIGFRQVSFSYRQGEDLLKDLYFDIEASAHIALVGPSGCGKTTLLALLLRLYEPQAGEILVDGVSLRQRTLASLREQIGFSLQEPLLWNDTIANNIRFGCPAAPEAAIEEAAGIALVDEFAVHFRDGYATPVGENACKLSEGQKQKIAIARALIKKPRILILDEAMASMDSASEERILANIKKHCAPLTLIVVSHRLSALMSADSVYYLAKPDEVLMDTPANFLRYNDSFAALFAGQICAAQ